MDDRERRARAHRTMDAALDRILAHDMAGFAELWAPDGILEFPFATAASPSRLQGRSAVAAYVADYNRLVLPAEVVEQRRHDTADADTVIVEFTVAGHVTSTGDDYSMSYVAIVTVGDAGIECYRDYWSPAAVQDVMGQQDLAGQQA